MAISRAQLAKELEPGLNSLFGMSYDSYDRQYEEIFAIEDSQRAFEEEVLITGFGGAPNKTEGQGYNNASSYTARYTHETVALARLIISVDALRRNTGRIQGTSHETILSKEERATTIPKGSSS
jgi:hypothetical protein